MTPKTASFGRWLAAAAVVGLIVVLPAAAADFDLHLVSQTTSTITLGWDARSNVVNYTFYANGRRVSNSYDGTRTTATFSKVSCSTTPCYAVQALVSDGIGGYPSTTPPPPPPGDTSPPATPVLSTSNVTLDGFTVSWPASIDNVGTTGYDVYLGATLAGTLTSSPAVFSGLDCGTNYTVGVVAFDAAGNRSGQASVNVATTSCSEPPPPPPPGGTITSSQCSSLAMTSSATIANVTVTGGCSVGGTNVTFDNVVIQGTLSMGNGTHVTNGSVIRKFQAFGADNWVIENSILDGQGLVANNEIWDYPAGNTASGWTIRNNTIRNYYVASNPGTHSEGIYNGYSTNGLIEGNTFTNNGNTGHIFFTWFGSTANASTSYPRNICVRGNTFGATHGAYVDINFRSEIPTSSNIKIQSDASTTSPQFYGTC